MSKNKKNNMRLYRFLKKLLEGIFKVTYRIKVEGKENEPVSGPFLVCANHLSAHDVIIVGTSVKCQLRYFAKASLFKIPLLKNLITALGAFPVDKSAVGTSTAAIKQSIALLQEGQIVGIFPQGHRMPGVDPRTTKTKNGAGMMVYHAKCPVLPVCIQTKNWKIGLFKRTKVIIGKPISYEEFTFEEGKNSEYAEAAQLIFSRITALIEDNGSEKDK